MRNVLNVRVALDGSDREFLDAFFALVEALGESDWNTLPGPVLDAYERLVQALQGQPFTFTAD